MPHDPSDAVPHRNMAASCSAVFDDKPPTLTLTLPSQTRRSSTQKRSIADGNAYDRVRCIKSGVLDAVGKRTDGTDAARDRGRPLLTETCPRDRDTIVPVHVRRSGHFEHGSTRT